MKQNYPHFDLIFVDSASNDRTARIVESLASKSEKLVFTKSRSGPSAARNEGLRLAQGQAIAFVDGDSFVDENWLQRAMHDLQSSSDPRTAAVGGPFVQVPQTSSNTAITISEIESTGLGRGGSVVSHNEGGPSYAKSLSLSGALFWSDVVRQVGNFDEKLRYCEDSDFCHRARSIGYKLLSFGDLGAFHVPKYSSLGEFADKMWNYGLGRGRAVKHDWRLMTSVGLAVIIYLATFVGTLIIGLGFGSAISKLLALLLGGFYLAAISSYSLVVSSKRHSIRSFFIGIAAFLALHVPYSLGLLTGMIAPGRKRSGS